MFSVVLRVMNGNGYNPREVVDVPLAAKDGIIQIFKDNEREVDLRSETASNRDDSKVIARIRTMPNEFQIACRCRLTSISRR